MQTFSTVIRTAAGHDIPLIIENDFDQANEIIDLVVKDIAGTVVDKPPTILTDLLTDQINYIKSVIDTNGDQADQLSEPEP